MAADVDDQRTHVLAVLLPVGVVVALFWFADALKCHRDAQQDRLAAQAVHSSIHTHTCLHVNKFIVSWMCTYMYVYL